MSDKWHGRTPNDDDYDDMPDLIDVDEEEIDVPDGINWEEDVVAGPKLQRTGSRVSTLLFCSNICAVKGLRGNDLII